MEKDKDLQKQKRELRKKILDTRESLSPAERKQAQERLAARISSHEWFLSAGTVIGFAAYGSEIDIDTILTETLRAGKKLYLPKVEGDVMQFYRVFDLSELQTGYKGIREPDGSTEPYVYVPQEAEDVCMLMPGAAFDKEGRRMGYGKGFYDRYLTERPKLCRRTIGLGFSCQMVEEVPHGAQDISLCQVICV